MQAERLGRKAAEASNIGQFYRLAQQHRSVLQVRYATYVSDTSLQHRSVLQARSTKDKSYRLDLQSMNVIAPSSKVGQVLQARPGK